MASRTRHLGRLTKSAASSAPTAEARRVVAAFLRGEAARGACRYEGKGKPPVCDISTDGHTLEVGRKTLATHQGTRMTVCVPATASMEKRAGKQRETQSARDVRVAASLLLRRVAGIGVRTSGAGDRLLAAKGRAALLMPAACVEVQVPKRQAALLAIANNATDAAKARYKTAYPTRRQIDAMRKMLLAEKRMAALFMARQKRGKGRAALPADEYDYTPAPEDRGVPFDVEDLLEPAGEDYDTAPPESWAVVEDQAADLPKDVPNPTDPDAYAQFVSEYLPRLRQGAKRTAALSWQAYLLDPRGRTRPTVAQGFKAGAETERLKRAAREVELELAGDYGIVDPIHGFEPPDVAQRSAAQARGARARRAKVKGGGAVSEQAIENLKRAREGLDTGYSKNKAEKAQWNRFLRTMYGKRKIKTLKD